MLQLHIGRPLAGQSVIQRMAEKFGPVMGDRGCHVLTQMADFVGVGSLTKALEKGAAKTKPIESLLESMDEHEHMFISVPSLFDAEVPERLAQALSGRPVQLMAYISDYQSWIVSRYARRIMSGDAVRPFDDFFEGNREKASALPALTRWADAFGWKALRVRSVDPRDLVGGSVASDLWRALYIGDDPPDVPDTPIWPNWLAMEMIRAMRSQLAADKTLSTGLIDQMAPCVPWSRIDYRYLTDDQAKDLAALYAQDINVLSEKLDHDFPPPPPPVPGRTGEMTLANAPAAEREAISDNINALAIARNRKSRGLDALRATGSGATSILFASRV